MPPGAEQPFWLERSRVSREYLEAMAMHVIQLALNTSPATAELQGQALLRLVSPAAYGEVQKAIEGNVARLRATSSATTFWPGEIQVDVENKAVAFRGLLNTWIGDRRTSQAEKAYVVRFAYRHGRLVVVELREGDRKEPLKGSQEGTDGA
jgi:conjugal transfer pilus assembly protein TraE